MTHRVQILFLVLVAGCGGSATGLPTGTDGGPCYANGTCNAALECVASTCTASHDGAVEVDGNVGVDSAVVGDGAVVTVDSGSADSGSTDSGSADSGSADSGSTDSGRPDGGTPLSNCLYSDTDTGSFSYQVRGFGSHATRLNIDGVGNENMVAGCGVTDTVEGYDNGFGAMTAAEFGGSPHGTSIPNYDVRATTAFALNNPEQVSMTVTLTHLSSSISVDPNDGCARITISLSRPFVTYPPVAGVVTIENGHVQGQLDGPLDLHFTGFGGPGTIHDLQIREPVVDINIFNNFTVVDSARSGIGGYVFFRPAAADVGLYDSFYSFDAEMLRLMGTGYTNYLEPYLPQYQDIYMAPDGTRQPCSAGHGPNAMSITTRF